MTKTVDALQRWLELHLERLVRSLMDAPACSVADVEAALADAMNATELSLVSDAELRDSFVYALFAGMRNKDLGDGLRRAQLYSAILEFIRPVREKDHERPRKVGPWVVAEEISALNSLHDLAGARHRYALIQNWFDVAIQQDDPAEVFGILRTYQWNYTIDFGPRSAFVPQPFCWRLQWPAHRAFMRLLKDRGAVYPFCESRFEVTFQSVVSEASSSFSLAELPSTAEVRLATMLGLLSACRSRYEFASRLLVPETAETVWPLSVLDELFPQVIFWCEKETARLAAVGLVHVLRVRIALLGLRYAMKGLAACEVESTQLIEAAEAGYANGLLSLSGYHELISR